MKDIRLPIEDVQDYEAARMKVAEWRKKGEENLSDKKTGKLRLLMAAIKDYEQAHPAPPSENLIQLLEVKMFERRMKQNELALLLGIAESKLSQIMNGKRKADVAFLQAVHKKLGIDGNVLLNSVSK